MIETTLRASFLNSFDSLSVPDNGASHHALSLVRALFSAID